MYVCVGVAKRDACPLMYRGLPTGAFIKKKKLNLVDLPRYGPYSYKRALEEKTSKWADHRTGSTTDHWADHRTTGEINRWMDVPGAVV